MLLNDCFSHINAGSHPGFFFLSIFLGVPDARPDRKASAYARHRQFGKIQKNKDFKYEEKDSERVRENTQIRSRNAIHVSQVGVRLRQPCCYKTILVCLSLGTPKMLDVGTRIRTRRKELGLTQNDICREAGISKGFFSDVENGKRNLSSSHLLDISVVLDCSCDHLLKGGKEYSNAVMKKNSRKNDLEELKVVSVQLSKMAKRHAELHHPLAESYNECIRKMFVLGCFSTDDQCGKELFIDDLR